jgi:sugar/nucleoside kinase (ribokinase family)
MATHDRLSPISDVASRILPRLVRCPRIVITHGKHGCVTYQAGEPVHTMPAFTQRVVDTVGAGDAFFAVTAPLVAAGAPAALAGFVGNVVGSLKVEIVGHRKSVDKVSFLKAVTALTK